MTVGTYTYGTTDGLHRKVGWVIPSRAAFGVSTTPTLTQAEAILDEVAAEIHAALAEAGYPVSTKTVVAAAAPRAAAWLTGLNEAGASAVVLAGFITALDPETEKTPEGFWEARYKAGKKMINGAFLDNLGLSRERELSALLVCTSIEDESGVEKEPLFKRDMWQYPGSWPVAEES